MISSLRSGYSTFRPTRHLSYQRTYYFRSTSVIPMSQYCAIPMDWRWWKLAKEKGVKCAINPDAHNTAGLQFLYFCVLQARKGWLTKDDVINCLPLGEIEEALAVKR